MDFRNRLLAALPPDERQRLQPHLEPVVLRSRQVVRGCGGSLEQTPLRPRFACLQGIYREIDWKFGNQVLAALLKRKTASAVRSLAANSLVLETGNLCAAEQGRSDAPREQNREPSEASREDYS